MFVACVEAIIYLLLYNLLDWIFKSANTTNVFLFLLCLISENHYFIISWDHNPKKFHWKQPIKFTETVAQVTASNICLKFVLKVSAADSETATFQSSCKRRLIRWAQGVIWTYKKRFLNVLCSIYILCPVDNPIGKYLFKKNNMHIWTRLMPIFFSVFIANLKQFAQPAEAVTINEALENHTYRHSRNIYL